MLVHSSELYKAPKVFYSIDMVYPQANTFFSCNLYIICISDFCNNILFPN